VNSCGDVHKSRKRAALEPYRSTLKSLPSASRLTVGRFVDELQARLPTLGQKELAATVEVMTNLEKSRSGYVLLEQLAALQPNDLDRLSDILQTWSVREVATVLSELEWRLKLIEKMETLLEDPSADELHDIQPLFDRGLWIFGPEYEAISFVSNRALVTVLRELLHDSITVPSSPRHRPDIVALPDSTISIYSRDAFDDQSEVAGIAKVLIVELKRGGFTVTNEEKVQALKYARNIRKSGKVERSTNVVGFVLGTKIADDAHDPLDEGSTTIIARAYSTVLRQANARTFNLLQQIRKTRGVEEVIRMPERARLF
jgi:hypothetical protein